MSNIGVNTSGIDQNLIIGKEISNTGKGIDAKKAALELAKVHEGSEIVYSSDDDSWHVAELKEKGILFGADDLSNKDSSKITLDTAEMKKAKINNAVISFVEEKASSDEKADVVANPSTSTEILSKLSRDKSEYVRSKVASNPKTTENILLNLSKDYSEYVRANVASNPKTPEIILINLRNDDSENVREAVVSHPRNPVKNFVDTLIYLSTDLSDNVRIAVASNSQTPSKILELLSDDSSEDVLKAVSKNPNTTTKTLIKIASNGDEHLKFRMAIESKNTDFLKELVKDKNPHVSTRANLTLEVLEGK